MKQRNLLIGSLFLVFVLSSLHHRNHHLVKLFCFLLLDLTFFSSVSSRAWNPNSVHCLPISINTWNQIDWGLNKDHDPSWLGYETYLYFIQRSKEGLSLDLKLAISCLQIPEVLLPHLIHHLVISFPWVVITQPSGSFQLKILDEFTHILMKSMSKDLFIILIKSLEQLEQINLRYLLITVEVKDIKGNLVQCLFILQDQFNLISVRNKVYWISIV